MGKEGVKTHIFINECSLHGQFQTIDLFEQSVKIFMSIFDLINKNENLNKELYKNEVFIEYEAIKNSPFQASLNQIKDRSLKTAFRNLIFNKLNPVDWRIQQFHRVIDKFIVTDTSCNVTNTSIAEVAERKLLQNEFSFLLVNFSNSVFKVPHTDFSLCHLIAVVKNDEAGIDLDCLDSKAALEQWVQNKLDSRNFIERNTNKFSKTTNIVQGQSVFVDLESGGYWYLDNLHKNHFEVFNKQGVHLGEANLSGVLDVEKNDTKKMFKQ